MAMKNRGSLITFMILLAVSLLAGLYMVAPYVQALLMGGILAIIMLPLYRILRARRVARHPAAAITTGAMIFLMLAPFLLFTAITVKQAMTFAQWILSIEHISLEDFLMRVSSWQLSQYFGLDAGELDTYLRKALQYLGSTGSKFALGLASSIPEGILKLALACMACYCLLTDGRDFSNWIFGKIPMDSEIRSGITQAFKNTAISVVLASMAAAGAQSLIMMFAFLVLGVPSAFLAGGATFVFAWIPIVGSTPVWLSGAAFLYFNGFPLKAGLIILFGVATGTIDNFVRPMVLKGRGEMHPLVSLVAIFGGLQLFGFFGVFLGPILVAVVVTLLQLWPVVARPFGLIFASDEDPSQGRTAP